MKRNTDLGHAFLDIAFVGAIGTTIALLLQLITGGGLNLWLLGAGVLTYVAYFVAAIRLGSSPGKYIRFVGRRGQPPI